MALNMYYKNGVIRKTRSQISDELLTTLYQVHNNANFSQLTWLIDNLYENPQIQPDVAKMLADEMVAFERLLLSLHLPFLRELRLAGSPFIPVINEFFALARFYNQS